jgi:hypothetical protein
MSSRYNNILEFRSPDGYRYKTNPIYPEIPVSDQDTYVITSDGDRYDILALNFYGDVRLWWIIASANNATKDNLVIKPGLQIRIPANKDQVLRLFEKINQ